MFSFLFHFFLCNLIFFFPFKRTTSLFFLRQSHLGFFPVVCSFNCAKERERERVRAKGVEAEYEFSWSDRNEIVGERKLGWCPHLPCGHSFTLFSYLFFFNSFFHRFSTLLSLFFFSLIFSYLYFFSSTFSIVT